METGRIKIVDIQRRVHEEWNLPPYSMTTQARRRDIARPRQIAMWLSRRLTKKSLPYIGSRFGGRDHTTVLHACRAVEKLIKRSPEIAARVEAIETDLKAMAALTPVNEFAFAPDDGDNGIEATVYRAQRRAYEAGAM